MFSAVSSHWLVILSVMTPCVTYLLPALLQKHLTGSSCHESNPTSIHPHIWNQSNLKGSFHSSLHINFEESSSDNQLKLGPQNPFLSDFNRTFKVKLILFLFLLTCLHLFISVFFPNTFFLEHFLTSVKTQFLLQSYLFVSLPYIHSRK